MSNTGNQPTGALNIALSGTDSGSFTLSKTSITNIAAGGSDNFTVVPNNSLAAGTYSATVTVSGTNVTSQSFSVSFTVNSLVNAQAPDITTQPAGATYAYVGGLVGNNSSNIENSAASGRVTGGLFVGGLAGHNESGAQISNSMASGYVKGNDANSPYGNTPTIGGLIGYNSSGDVSNSFATGRVAGSHTGGLYGYTSSTTALQSVFDLQGTSQGSQEYASGKSTQELMSGS
ncbi:MAG: hypothetical protein LBQ58_03925 [Synergistaceae bacterium]|nr:hypothetical protein [Synergistaceae bacterium]